MTRLACSRCGAKKGTVERAHFFLCAACEVAFKTGAFGNEEPFYRRTADEGSCDLCSMDGPLSHCVWLLCDVCGRVAQSLGKGRVAASFVLGHVARALGGVTLRVAEVDSVIVRRPAKSGQKRPLATELDLHLLDAGGVRVLWIEVKTGMNSVTQMKEFQLDCSDCNDIMNVVKISGVPALIAHAQVIKVPNAPTMRLVGQDAWWVDMYTFRDAFRHCVERRGDGRKKAAVFDPSCFKEMAELADFFSRGGIEQLTARMAQEGVPVLYDETRGPPPKARKPRAPKR